jgi:hypothetical protein
MVLTDDGAEVAVLLPDREPLACRMFKWRSRLPDYR